MNRLKNIAAALVISVVSVVLISVAIVGVGCAEFWDGMYGTEASPAVPATPEVPATPTTPVIPARPAQPAKPATPGAAGPIVATATALNPAYGAVIAGALVLVALFKPKKKET